MDRIKQTSKRKSTVGGKSNRYIEPQIYPKTLPNGYVGKGKDKQFWQIKNGTWVKPQGITQIALKKIYFMQIKNVAEKNAKKVKVSTSKSRKSVIKYSRSTSASATSAKKSSRRKSIRNTKGTSIRKSTKSTKNHM